MNTTGMVMTVTDELLAELELHYRSVNDDSRALLICELRRLRAENADLAKDAGRYRWLCASVWYVGPEPRGDTEAVSWHDHNETKSGVTQAIDTAMATK